MSLVSALGVEHPSGCPLLAPAQHRETSHSALLNRTQLIAISLSSAVKFAEVSVDRVSGLAQAEVHYWEENPVEFGSCLELPL